VTVSTIPVRPPGSFSSIRSSDAHSTAGRSTLELAVGREPPVTLLYVELDSRIYVLPSFPPGEWFVGAVREGRAEVRWPDGSTGFLTARLRDGSAILARLRDRVESKYGEGTWKRYFAQASAALELTPGSRRDSVGPLDRVRGEFDAVADAYDARVSAQPVERYLKDRVAAFAVNALEGLDPILEVGPGTGYHTLPLLAAGHRVVAVDISERMLGQLRSRATSSGFADRLEVRCGPASELGRVMSDFPDGAFGGVFSAFGALDLERDLGELAPVLHRLVRPSGRFVLTSLNRPGWSPLFWELAMGRPRTAGARLRRSIPADGIRYPLTLYPRTPTDWDEALRPSFERLAVVGVSVLAPPFNANRPVRVLGRSGTGRLRRWDEWLTARRISWAASEWLFLTYLRTNDDGPAKSSSTGPPPAPAPRRAAG